MLPVTSPSLYHTPSDPSAHDIASRSKSKSSERLSPPWTLTAKTVAWFVGGIILAAAAAGVGVAAFVFTFPVSLSLTALITIIVLSSFGGLGSFAMAYRKYLHLKAHTIALKIIDEIPKEETCFNKSKRQIILENEIALKSAKSEQDQFYHTNKIEGEWASLKTSVYIEMYRGKATDYRGKATDKATDLATFNNIKSSYRKKKACRVINDYLNTQFWPSQFPDYPCPNNLSD